MMCEETRYYITTAIDYPNSRPHIGTAFEKIGADVQARYRRMEGYDVHFLMGNDENTIKVSQRAEELGREPKAYCDDMARQFQEVWQALDISFDDFIQTSEPRHHAGCRKFIQKVYDAGTSTRRHLRGLVLRRLRGVQDREGAARNGRCPNHPNTPLRAGRGGELLFPAVGVQDRLLAYYEANPDFIQPESRRNEIVSLVKSGLQDVNITRKGFTWGIPVPFDPEQTIYVWFDALLNYITASATAPTTRGSERLAGRRPLHRQGHHPVPLRPLAGDADVGGLAAAEAGLRAWVCLLKNEETGEVQKISKSLGNVVEPMDVIKRFSAPRRSAITS